MFKDLRQMFFQLFRVFPRYGQTIPFPKAVRKRTILNNLTAAEVLPSFRAIFFTPACLTIPLFLKPQARMLIFGDSQIIIKSALNNHHAEIIQNLIFC